MANPFGDEDVELPEPAAVNMFGDQVVPESGPLANPMPGRLGGEIRGTADSALELGGEIAAGGNRALMYIPDTVAKAIRHIPGVSIPTPSEAIQSATGFAPGEGGFMEDGIGREIARLTGEGLALIGPGLAGVMGRDLSRVGPALAEFSGFGRATPQAGLPAILADTAQPRGGMIPTGVPDDVGGLPAVIDDRLPAVAGDAAPVADDIIPTGVADDVVEDVDEFIPPSSDKRIAREDALKRGQGDIEGIGYRLNEDGVVVPDMNQKQAVKAGINPGDVGLVSSASKGTRKAMRNMMGILQQGRRNTRYRDANRPSKAIGKPILNRVKDLVSINRKAGTDIDKIAESQLKGSRVDASGPAQRFIEALKKNRILFDKETGKVDFSNSSIKGLPELESLVKRVLERFSGTKTEDAFDLHWAKRFLDEQVTYGKNQTGMSGRMESIFKDFRHDIDAVLDNNFPDYDAANTAYSSTIGLIDDVQSLVGNRVDMSSGGAKDALGVMSRKVLSNYNTGTPIRELFKNMEDVLGAQGIQYPESIPDLASYDSIIRQMFPDSIPKGTFQGIIGQEVGRGAVNAATGNKVGMVGQMTDAARRKLAASEDDTIKALNDLLQD